MFNGFFGQLAIRYWGIRLEMWHYFKRSNFFVKIVALPVVLLYAPFLFLTGCAFAILLPLDWIGALFESIRIGTLRFYSRMSRESGDNLLGFLLLPPLLVALAPIILALVILPKIGGLNEDG